MQRVGVLARQIVASAQCDQLVGTPCSADVAKQMAPTGKLRVALNMRNELLITGKSASGEPDGLAPSMAAKFAEKLGVPIEYVPYDSPDALIADAAADKWDVAMIGADPARGEHVEFTAPYCGIEATFAVPTTSGIQKCAEVNKAGVKVASCKGAAYTLFLEANFKNCSVETVEGHDETYAKFVEDGLQAVAGLRPKMKKDNSKRPASRLLRDKFMAVEQAAACKKGRPEGFKMLCEFIDEAKKSGLVKELMTKFKVQKDLAIL